jgi:putative ABC transport system substrate-binding protein
MKRREFITLLGGAAAWPFAARAQQGERMRRIGVFMSTRGDDPEGLARVAALLQGLQEGGWSVGRNIRIEYRWGRGGAEANLKTAGELVALAPHLIVAYGTSTVAPLLRLTRSLPIVLVGVIDPVGAGFVASLACPGGNATGFSSFEYGMSGKWLELLKQIAPGTNRAAVLRDPAIASGSAQFGAIQAVAPFLGLEVSPIDVRDVGAMEQAIGEFARPNSGLIVTGGASTTSRRKLIIAQAARHRLPAVYPFPHFSADGGLISYGPNATDPMRRAAAYVDRILKGEQPADLPVQAPTKYDLVINLKTAKELGLDIPPTVLARADEVIE